MRNQVDPWEGDDMNDSADDRAGQIVRDMAGRPVPEAPGGEMVPDMPAPGMAANSGGVNFDRAVGCGSIFADTRYGVAMAAPGGES